MSKSIINFIDCGAHKGQSIIACRNLFGPQCDELHVHSFEAIPYLAKKLQAYYQEDPLVHVYNNAVWISDEEKQFFASKTKASWGSSLYSRFTDTDTVSTTVTCVDFPKWVRDTLNPNEVNILKLDIEGAEYEVLNKLMDTGTLEYFNLLVGEWHHDKVQTGLDPYKTVDRLKREYNTELKIWEAPWYDETTPGMVSFEDAYAEPEAWLNY